MAKVQQHIVITEGEFEAKANAAMCELANIEFTRVSNGAPSLSAYEAAADVLAMLQCDLFSEVEDDKQV